MKETPLKQQSTDTVFLNICLKVPELPSLPENILSSGLALVSFTAMCTANSWWQRISEWLSSSRPT